MSAAPKPQKTGQTKPFLSEGDLNAVQLTVAQLVGSAKRVLVVGSITDVLLRQLHSQECEISVIDRRRRTAIGAAGLCRQILVGDIERLTPAREFGQGSFDCIVAIGLLESVKNPQTVLVRLKECLQAEGFLVAAVPNTSHGGVRLEFLEHGRFALRQRGARGPAQFGNYDRESLESLLDEAGFALGRLERHRMPLEASLSSENLASVAPDLLESLSKDPEATTSHFIALAYPLPNLSLDWLGEKMRRLTKENDAARRELADLRPLPQRLAGMEQEIALFRETRRAEEKRHDSVRAELAAATAQVEHLAQENQVLRDELARHEATREQLLEISAQRKRLSDENQRLSADLGRANAERDTAGRVEEEGDRLRADFEKTLRREKHLRDELARCGETADRVRELEDACRAAEERIRAMEASPGWRLISSYRGWLSRQVWTRPWLRRPYETLAARLLPGAGSGQAGPSENPVSGDGEMAAERTAAYLERLADSTSFVHEDDLRFAWENPPAGAVPVRGTIEVRGWAIALEGVSRATLRIGDGPEISTDYGHLRPDVARRHSEFPNASRSGFRFQWDTTEIPDGVHRLRAAIETQAGRRRELRRDVLVDQRDPYHVWIERNEPSSLDKRVMRDDLDKFAYQPTISVLTPVHKTPRKLLSACVESVIAQIYPHWELCLVDDGSADPQLSALLEDFAQRDSRIKVRALASSGGIAGATNAALAMCGGEYVAFLDHDDELADFALFEVVRKLHERPRPDMLYSDEDKMDLEGRRYDWFFKPDWSPDLLHAVNYVCHLLVCRRSLALEVGGLREGFEGSQDFDLVLRLAERTQAIKRIPKILYHWRALPGSTSLDLQQKPDASSAGRRALEEHLARSKERGEACETAPCRYRVRRHVRGNPEVSVLMPTAGNMERLEAALKSVIDETAYRRFEIVVVDNSAGDQVAGLAERLRYSRRPVRYADFRGEPFNFSQLCNRAARLSEAPFYLFLNDDVTVVTAEWLTALVEHGQRDDVGAVGARLLYPNGRIQHAGVVMGVYENAGHHFKGVKSDEYYYFDLPGLVRNCAAVTGACMLLRRERFWEVGGFDEQNLPIAFQDVDLCLKLLQRGYLNVYTPYATLYHHEASSKSAEQYVPSDAEISYMQHRWRNYIENDPYSNPNLTRQREDYGLRW